MRLLKPSRLSLFALLAVVAVPILLLGGWERLFFPERPSWAERIQRAFATALDEPAIIWTNRVELAEYATLFNAAQVREKVVVVYKEDPAASLSSIRSAPQKGSKGHHNPSLVISSGLHSLPVAGSFRQVTNLFTKGRISRGDFYPGLLAGGNVNGNQYLLPLSFNLPAVIFNPTANTVVPDDFMLTLDNIKAAGKKFNRKDNRGMWTAMGFAPSWSPEFLYLATGLLGANYRVVNHRFAWNDNALSAAIQYLRSWTLDSNGSTVDEQDFAFKYLTTPPYRQVLDGRCLFAFTTSDVLFSAPSDQLALIDFRWLHREQKIPLADSLVYAAIPKHAPRTIAAQAFLEWLLREDTQTLLLEKTERDGGFGIAGGFSSLMAVNDRAFPARYPPLLGNIPIRDFIADPEVFPANWPSLKSQVLFPYLADAVNTAYTAPALPLAARYTEWSKGPLR